MSAIAVARGPGVLVLMLLASLPGVAAAGQTSADGVPYLVHADVVDVAPRYGWHETVQPVRRCIEDDRRFSSQRYRHDPGHRRRTGSATGPLLGGLLGGLIGHQFGDGRGRTALTIAGAALGASLASDRAASRERASRHSRHYDTHRRDGYGYGDSYGYDDGYGYDTRRGCTVERSVSRSRRVEGYDVTYRYHGRTFHKFVTEPPGDTVAVRVDVEPLPR